MRTNERLTMLETKFDDHCKNNNEHFKMLEESCKIIKKDIKDVKNDLYDLRVNHIVFKTRILAYWAVGAGILSAIIQIIINYFIKKI